MRHLIFAAILAIVCVPTFAAAGDISPLDITGTWEGSAKCTFIGSSGDLEVQSGPVIMNSTTNADTGSTAVEFTGTGPGLSGSRGIGPEGLCGFANEIVGKPDKGIVTLSVFAQGGFAFDPDFPVAAINFKSVKVFPENNGLSGKMKGFAVIVPGPAPFHGSCSIKLKRVSTATPALDSELLDACGVSGGI